MPQLYILSTSEFAPSNGAIIQMYAHLNGNSILKPTTSQEAELYASTKDYESWSCNMLFYDDVSDKSQEDMIEVFFYRGPSDIGKTSGTYSGVNSAELVELSAWKNDPDLTKVALSEQNAVKEQYYIYQCAMFRKLEDELSHMQLKVEDRVEWTYGYKLYSSKGDYVVDIADTGSGELLVLDSATGLLAAALIYLSVFAL